MLDGDDHGHNHDPTAILEIVCVVFLTFPATVLAIKPAGLLSANGYYFLSALQSLPVSDLGELGMLRGHAQMVVRALRPPPPEAFDMNPSPLRFDINGTNVTAPALRGGAPPHLSRARCRPFPAQLTSRTWRASMMAFVVVLRTIGLPSPVPDAVFAAGVRPGDGSAPLDAVLFGMVWDTLLSGKANQENGEMNEKQNQK